MRRKLFITSLIVCTLVLAEHSLCNNLNLFDFGRFGNTSSNDTQQISRQPSSTFKPEVDNFSIGANGVLSRTNDYRERYSSSNIGPAGTGPSATSLASGFGSRAKYSISNVSTEIRCEVSPLPPSEIEKLIIATANRYGVDPTLAAAVGWNESRFDRVRNSPKGARGPMQLLPETASRFGVGDICDPVANIDGGVRYLRVLLDQFQNPLLAAAAYNAGEQAVYDHHGIPPFPETVGYVAGVLNYQLGLQPSADSKAGRDQKLIQSRETSPENTGVIGVASRAKFVAGVMQF